MGTKKISSYQRLKQKSEDQVNLLTGEIVTLLTSNNIEQVSHIKVKWYNKIKDFGLMLEKNE